MQASGLLARTPGAKRPADSTLGEIAAFGDRQTGQLDKANDDKDGADRILATCEEQNAAAAAELKKKRGWR